MKVLLISFYYCLILFSLVYSSTMSNYLAKLKIQKKNPNEQTVSIAQKLIHYRNWMKYYHYVAQSGSPIKKPKEFFQNNEYYSQRGLPLGNYLSQKDKKGIRQYIPSKEEFYIVLYNETLSVYASREDMFRRQIDSFPLEYIKQIAVNDRLGGGVRFLGLINSNIGYCVGVYVDIPKSYKDLMGKIKEVWIFCQNSEKDIQAFLETLIKLKLDIQKKNALTKDDDALSQISPTLLGKSPNPEERKTAIKNPVDGYWLLLQDWSECSLKCGGGQKFQQWQCVPPKDGGKPCEGKAIRTKPCNTQPCPTVAKLLEVVDETIPIAAKPVIKMGQFSGRLTRYGKCEIKETDAFIATFDPVKQTESKIPIRMVMNNSTLTLYQDDSYINLIHSFILERTSFIRNRRDYCCFFLKDNLKFLKLCGFDQTCAAPENKNPIDELDTKFVRDWESDFKLFKTECKVGRETTLIRSSDEAEIDAKIRKKRDQVRVQIKNEETNRLQQLQIQDNLPGGKTYHKIVKKAQDITLNAIQKEMILEQMLKNEEKQREEEEIFVLRNQIEQEKEKARNMDFTIKEKELDETFIAEEKKAEAEVQLLKEEAIQKIQKKRELLKKKIEAMKAAAKTRKSVLENELNSVRKAMAEKFIRANKIGNMETCKNGVTDDDMRIQYCDKSFTNDYIENQECKKQEEFCPTCCEVEFGNIHIDKREECYTMCDLLKRKSKS